MHMATCRNELPVPGSLSRHRPLSAETRFRLLGPPAVVVTSRHCSDGMLSGKQSHCWVVVPLCRSEMSPECRSRHMLLFTLRRAKNPGAELTGSISQFWLAPLWQLNSRTAAPCCSALLNTSTHLSLL